MPNLNLRCHNDTEIISNMGSEDIQGVEEDGDVEQEREGRTHTGREKERSRQECKEETDGERQGSMERVERNGKRKRERTRE